MLRIESISLAYTEKTMVLRSVNAKLHQGRMYGIAGKSGAGKSSLLKIIGGILDQSSGKIYLNDQRMPFASQLLIPGHPSIALVPQDFKLDPYHTCIENIREAILNWEPKKRERRVKSLLNLLELTGVQHTKAFLLSGGEQQRVALARALACEPTWLLLDEPFSHLDASLRIKFSRVLLKLINHMNIGIVLVSHDAHEMLGICDEMAFLQRGRLSKFEPPIKRYLSLKNLNEASWFGPVNTVIFESKKVRFRPNFFELADTGLHLDLSSHYFNGITYIHYFYTKNKEEVVLFYPNQLPNQITIQIKNAFEVK